MKPSFTVRSSCPVCLATDAYRLYSCLYDSDPIRALVSSSFDAQGTVDWALLSGVDFTVDHCRQCDLIYQVNVPDEAMLEVIYTRMIGNAFLSSCEESLLTLENFHRIAGEFTVLFKRIGKHPTQIRMLDFGMGHGRWARVARAMGATVFATEIGEDKKRLGRSLGVEVIDDAAIDSMQFDLVHTEQVMEHLLYPEREFARLARAVVPGGLFKVAVPYRGRLAKLLPVQGMPSTALFADGGSRPMPGDKEAFAAIQPLEHLNAYSDKTMAWLAARNELALLSPTRRRSTSFGTGSLQEMVQGLKQIGTEAAKTLLSHQIGYFLFRKAG